MRTSQRIFIEASIIVMLMMATSPSFAGDGNLGAVVDLYKTSSMAFYGKLQGYAVEILWKLFAVELAWQAIKWALERKPFEEMLSQTVTLIFPPTFFLLIIQKGSEWFPAILKSFEFLGSKASGLDVKVLDAGAIFEQGLRLQNNMILAFNSATGVDAGGVSGAVNALESFFPALLMFTVCIVILLAFAIMAFNVFILWAEAYLLIGVAPVLMAFAGMRWTRDVAPKTFNSMIAAGVKILVLMLLMSVVANLAPIWAAEAAQWKMEDWSPLWRVAFSALGCGFLAWKAPQIAANAIAGTSSLTAGDALQMATMAAAAAVGATALAGKGADSLLGAAQNGASSLNGMAPSLGQAFGEHMGMRGGTMEGYGSKNKDDTPMIDSGTGLPNSYSGTDSGNAKNASLAGDQAALEYMRNHKADQAGYESLMKGMAEQRTKSEKIQDALHSVHRAIPNDQATVGGDAVKLKD